MGSFSTTEDSVPGGYIDFELPVPILASEPSTVELDWRVDDDPWGPAMVWYVDFTDDPELIPDEQVQLLAAQLEASSDLTAVVGGREMKMDVSGAAEAVRKQLS